jgi:trk system potassium uptake protein TrkH
MSAVIRHLAIVLIGLSVLMVLPALMALADADRPIAAAFITPAILTAGLAGSIIVALRDLTPPLSRAGSLFLIIVTWPCLALVAALPLARISALTFGASLFECLSALTTTGMSLIVNLDSQPAAILFWRALLQWYGGALTLVMMVLLLAPMAVGGLPHRRVSLVSLARTRHGGHIIHQVRIVLTAYGLTTLACMVWLIASGANPAEAVFLALSTLSTGGMTPRSEPLESYIPAFGQIGLIVFMILGATSILWQGMILRRDGHQLLRHRESYAVIGAVFAVGLVFAGLYHLAAGKGLANMPTALLEGLFAGASLISTTGFHVREESFSVLPLTILFLCALVGGGAMSTAGGLKMFRVGVLLRQAERELSKSLFPHGVKMARAGGHVWIDEDVRGICAMVVASVLILAFTGAGLALAGLPFAPAIAAAIAAFSNIGPLYGAGPIAAEPWPALSDLPAYGLGFLGIAMVVGRIEVLALFGVLNIAYWRNR